jgi:hypothetical protein
VVAGRGDEAAALPEFGADVGAAGRGDPGDRLVVSLAVETFAGFEASVVVDQIYAVDRHDLTPVQAPRLLETGNATRVCQAYDGPVMCAP